MACCCTGNGSISVVFDWQCLKISIHISLVTCHDYKWQLPWEGKSKNYEYLNGGSREPSENSAQENCIWVLHEPLQSHQWTALWLMSFWTKFDIWSQLDGSCPRCCLFLLWSWCFAVCQFSKSTGASEDSRYHVWWSLIWLMSNDVDKSLLDVGLGTLTC